VREVRRTIERLAKENGDLLELGRWEKEYCRVADFSVRDTPISESTSIIRFNLQERIVPYVPPPRSEMKSNRIFDDEAVSLDLALITDINEDAKTVTFVSASQCHPDWLMLLWDWSIILQMRLLRTEQCDITTDELETYVYAQRELFADERNTCKSQLPVITLSLCPLGVDYQ
jgi:hypothetical protein